MPRRCRHIVLVLAAAALLASGCGKPKVIPADKLADIYVEMFLADQWLRDNPEERSLADTTLFFDPIFRRHGYSFEDYDRSMQYYTSEPDEFSEVMTQVVDELRKIGQRLDAANKLREETLADYETEDFEDDSLWLSGRFLWPEAPADTLSADGQNSASVEEQQPARMMMFAEPPKAASKPATLKFEQTKS